MNCAGNYGDLGTQEALEVNPFNPCPGKPNCLRLSVFTDTTADSLFHTSVSTVRDMGYKIIESNQDSLSIKSEFKAFVFTDDFLIYITLPYNTSTDSTSVLHIRSSSRVGQSDLGVNWKRTLNFLELMGIKYKNDL